MKLKSPSASLLLVPLLAFGFQRLGAAESFTAAGITEAYWDVVLSASVPGIVTERKLQEGDPVEKGQVILELDNSVETLEVERRRLVMDARKKEFEDTQTLYNSSKGVSQDEVMKAELAYKVALVEHRIAAEQLRKRIIAAPFAGTIADYYLDEGEAAEAYAPLVHLVDTTRCYFVSNIEAKLAASLELNQTVQLEIETGATPVKVTGQIIYLAPVVDPASGLLKIKALFDNAQGRLRPGLAGVMKLK